MIGLLTELGIVCVRAEFGIRVSLETESRIGGSDGLEAGWLLRQGLVWVKDTIVLGRYDYHYQHEPLVYGYKAVGGGAPWPGRSGVVWR